MGLSSLENLWVKLSDSEKAQLIQSTHEVHTYQAEMEARRSERKKKITSQQHRITVFVTSTVVLCVVTEILVLLVLSGV